MHPLGKTVVRALIVSFTVISLFTSVLFAGQSYLFCSMLERAVDECCCASGHDDEARAPECDVRTMSTCCHVNEHASPGNGVTPVSAPVVAASSMIASAAPVAIIAPEIVVRRAPLLPEWNGPPLQERRAKLQVFLL